MDVFVRCDIHIEGEYRFNVNSLKHCLFDKVVPLASRDSFQKLPRVFYDEDLEMVSVEGETEYLLNGRVLFNVHTVDIFDAVRALDIIVNLAVKFGSRVDYRISSTILV